MNFKLDQFCDLPIIRFESPAERKWYNSLISLDFHLQPRLTESDEMRTRAMHIHLFLSSFLAVSESVSIYTGE